MGCVAETKQAQPSKGKLASKPAVARVNKFNRAPDSKLVLEISGTGTSYCGGGNWTQQPEKGSSKKEEELQELRQRSAKLDSECEQLRKKILLQQLRLDLVKIEIVKGE